MNELGQQTATAERWLILMNSMRVRSETPDPRGWVRGDFRFAPLRSSMLYGLDRRVNRLNNWLDG